MNTISKLILNNKEFIVSSALRPCGKMGYYAHELGKVTKEGELFGTKERYAHRVNKQMRVKGRHWIPKPFKSQVHAEVMAIFHSEENYRYF